MAKTYTPRNSVLNSSGNGFDLAENENLIVDQGIVIATTSGGEGVHSSGFNTITCNGTVAGEFGMDFVGSANLSVGTYGTVSGTVVGLNVYGNLTAENQGIIFGSYNGVNIFGSTTFTNDGTIRAGADVDTYKAAFYFGHDHTTSKLINNGLIENKVAGGYAIYADGDGAGSATVINSGTIVGKVDLGGGADVFDTTKGHVYGMIDGGPGNDKITGSAYADTMTGSSGRDTFYFKTSPDALAVDHITDFVHVEDHIGLSKALFPLDPGQTLATAFKAIDATTKSDSDDHIIYRVDKGALYYDADGYGGTAKPVLFAILDDKPATLTASDFLLV